MNINFAGHYQFIAKRTGGKLGGPPPKLDMSPVSRFIENCLPETRVWVLKTNETNGLEGLREKIEKTGIEIATWHCLYMRDVEPLKNNAAPEKVIVLTGEDFAAFEQSYNLMRPVNLNEPFVQGFFYRNHPNADVIEIEKKA